MVLSTSESLSVVASLPVVFVRRNMPSLNSLFCLTYLWKPFLLFFVSLDKCSSFTLPSQPYPHTTEIHLSTLPRLSVLVSTVCASASCPLISETGLDSSTPVCSLPLHKGRQLLYCMECVLKGHLDLSCSLVLKGGYPEDLID